MENSSLDEDLLHSNEQRMEYASFGQRAGATLVDVLCLAPVIGAVFYNNLNMKNMPLMLVLSLVMIAYKPFMEWRYSKTVGKMALNIKVADANGDKASLQAILLRNVFGIVAGVLSLISSYALYSNEDFLNAETFMEMSMVQQENDPIGAIASVPSLAYFLGLFVMFANNRKQCLHDIIGSTTVLSEK